MTDSSEAKLVSQDSSKLVAQEGMKRESGFLARLHRSLLTQHLLKYLIIRMNCLNFMGRIRAIIGIRQRRVKSRV
jgi:hypothetical protein